jgi:inner membrane protein
VASAFGHALAATAITDVGQGREARRGVRLWILAVVSGLLPDADVLGFKLGIPYGNWLGHRGFTHSILFGIVWSGLAAWFFFRAGRERGRAFWVLLASILSHGVLDAMTDGGLGVGFFIPFDQHRYFFAFRPIAVSPLGAERFFTQAQRILVNELIWVGVPCLILVVLARGLKWRRGRRTA